MKELIKQLLDIHEIVSSMKDFAMIKFKIEELNEETEAYKSLVDHNKRLINFLNEIKKYSK